MCKKYQEKRIFFKKNLVFWCLRNNFTNVHNIYKCEEVRNSMEGGFLFGVYTSFLNH